MRPLTIGIRVPHDLFEGVGELYGVHLRCLPDRHEAGTLGIAAVLLLYAPWIPTLITQAQHTAAPWSDRPTAVYLLWIPFTLFGEDDRWLATPLLLFAVVAALPRLRDRDGAIRVLAGLALGAALLRRRARGLVRRSISPATGSPSSPRTGAGGWSHRRRGIIRASR